MIYKLLGVGLCLLVTLYSRAAAEISLERPGDREFVRDTAGMLSPEDKAAIVSICDKLLTEKATPIIVITINQMSEHGGDGMRIETFARMLFDQWEIGHAELNGQIWNTGILVLISKGDRKARIELGGGWRRDHDQICKDIMDEQIIPRFKAQDFSGGIKAGVISLDAMARELQMPAVQQPAGAQSATGYGGQKQAQPAMPAWAPVAVVVFIGLAIFTVVSMLRNGSSGWAWLFWGALFSGIGYLLYQAATSRHSSGSSGGGFGGGSFGGGFSGGGGSTGSW